MPTRASRRRAAERGTLTVLIADEAAARSIVGDVQGRAAFIVGDSVHVGGTIAAANAVLASGAAPRLTVLAAPRHTDGSVAPPPPTAAKRLVGGWPVAGRGMLSVDMSAMVYARTCYCCGEAFALRPPLRRRCPRCGADLLFLNRSLTWRQWRRLAPRLRGRRGP